MREHAKYSPSSLNALHSCPSFLNKEGDNQYSIEGTELHEIMEKGIILEPGDPRFRLISKCRRMEREIVSSRIDICRDYRYYRELRLSTPYKDLWGTLDVLYLQDGVAVAIDYKFGYRQIEDVKDNLQAKSYVLGIFHNFPEIMEICFCFICPRQRNGYEFSIGKFYRDDDCVFLSKEVYGIINYISKNRGKCYNPSHSYCVNCQSFIICEEVKNRIKVFIDSL